MYIYCLKNSKQAKYIIKYDIKLNIFTINISDENWIIRQYERNVTEVDSILDKVVFSDLFSTKPN